MSTVELGARVMRSSAGNRPDGPWIVLRDITDQRGTYVLGHEEHGPRPAWVTVQAYPAQLEELEPRPCPGCGSLSRVHFHIRTGDEIPARFTPCPWEVSA